ncbi:MAG: hypothetical protein F4Y00_07280 [Bacteroidetes bacterium SB0662_bin_6]|nr:hypothetical protein [Bacteroidetes bacterium SB0668_bin_1]MYE04754.1 hypothetical protein [Bacteroidetes bacterium SB0662_bin_6]
MQTDYQKVIHPLVDHIREIQWQYKQEPCNTDNVFNDYRNKYLEQYDWYYPYDQEVGPDEIRRSFRVQATTNDSNVGIKGEYKPMTREVAHYIVELGGTVVDRADVKEWDDEVILWLVAMLAPDPAYIVPYTELIPKTENAQGNIYTGLPDSDLTHRLPNEQIR